MGTFNPTPVREEPSRQWLAVVGGAAVLVVLVGALAYFSRPAEDAATQQADPYADRLVVSEVKLGAAENFVGATVSYVEGKIANAGDKTVTDARVEVIFRNSLGEVVQKDRMPLHVLRPQMGGYTDVVDLRQYPLQPGMTDDFRLTFEHISSDWNRGYPEIKVVSTKTQ